MFKQFNTALQNSNVVAIEFKNQTRYIEPEKVTESFVVAYCRLRNAYRTFVFGKIASVKVTDEVFDKEDR